MSETSISIQVYEIFKERILFRVVNIKYMNASYSFTWEDITIVQKKQYPYLSDERHCDKENLLFTHDI